MNIVTDLTAGIAAEHLVCADLLLQGYRAFRSEQHCPYDIAVEHGQKLIRIQVKGTRIAREVPQRTNEIRAYMWWTRRAGVKGRRMYVETDFDMLALVALDIRVIAYFPMAATILNSIHLKPPGAPDGHANRRHRNVDQYPFSAAVDQLQK